MNPGGTVNTKAIPDHSESEATETAGAIDSVDVDGDRRRLLGASGLLAAAGLLWKPAESAQAAGGRGGSMILDVACIGSSFAPNIGGALDFAGGDLRGLSFYVEGLIYPAGTIPPGSGFDPDSAMAIGHWLCRGWFMNSPARQAPGAVTAQEYLLDIIDPVEAPSPPDTLVSSGLEGGAELFTRAVVGGTGRYRDARGEVIQHTIGLNTTTLNLFGAPAPNFRFLFDF